MDLDAAGVSERVLPDRRGRRAAGGGIARAPRCPGAHRVRRRGRPIPPSWSISAGPSPTASPLPPTGRCSSAATGPTACGACRPPARRNAGPRIPTASRLTSPPTRCSSAEDLNRLLLTSLGGWSLVAADPTYPPDCPFVIRRSDPGEPREDARSSATHQWERRRARRHRRGLARSPGRSPGPARSPRTAGRAPRRIGRIGRTRARDPHGVCPGHRRRPSAAPPRLGRRGRARPRTARTGRRCRTGCEPAGRAAPGRQGGARAPTPRVSTATDGFARNRVAAARRRSSMSTSTRVPGMPSSNLASRRRSSTSACNRIDSSTTVAASSGAASCSGWATATSAWCRIDATGDRSSCAASAMKRRCRSCACRTGTSVRPTTTHVTSGREQDQDGHPVQQPAGHRVPGVLHVVEPALNEHHPRRIRPQR